MKTLDDDTYDCTPVFEMEKQMLAGLTMIEADSVLRGHESDARKTERKDWIIRWR